jgi:hypothetical protein
VPYSAVTLKESAGDRADVDASWLVSRIARMPYSIARRRLDTYLFGQRVFAEVPDADRETTANALRGATSFPALALTLERLGFRQPDAYVAAARHAAALSAMPAEPFGRSSTMAFQGALAILDTVHRRGGLSAAQAQELARSLWTLAPAGDERYAQELAGWLQSRFVPAFPPAEASASDPQEIGLLSALAGVTPAAGAAASLEWEGQRYRVDPQTAEFRRLRRVRAQQGGVSLDAALAAATGTFTADAMRTLAEALTSILYAAHLGDPESQAVTSGNVAVRHDFSLGPWRLPAEDFAGSGGWRVRGSLLGLETALGRLALRRLDPTSMPGEPRIGSNDLQTLMMTAALFNARDMTDEARDEIAAAFGRGKARAAALTGDPRELDRAARDAGLSEWERQVLAWTAEHDPTRLAERFGPLQLFWLGSPRPGLLPLLRPWGVAAQPLSGCLCLDMPAPRSGEDLAGRPSAGILATRFADVAVQVADALKSLDVPAAVAPGVLQLALQETIDRTEPAHSADAAAFPRAAAALTRDQIIDFVAAQAAGGALIPEAQGQTPEK